MLKKEDINALDWAKVGDLMPAVVQNAYSGEVLMLGYMNREAVEMTLDTGKVTFYSRTKRRLWTKGESSEHWLHLVDIGTDCDRDTLLVLANPEGPTCHRGTSSCFSPLEPKLNFLSELERTIQERRTADPDSSYTAKLYASGVKRIAQKVGEEAVETALAAAAGDNEELKNEAADLVYHLLVLLSAKNLELADVVEILKARHRDRQREYYAGL